MLDIELENLERPGDDNEDSDEIGGKLPGEEDDIEPTESTKTSTSQKDDDEED